MTTFIAKIKKDGGLDFGSPFNASRFKQFCSENEGKSLRLEKIQSTRSLSQNNALHLWFQLIAGELNEAGYTVQLVLKQKVDLDWTKDSVKELLWRPAQFAILKKKSTTELKKIEDIDKVWEHLNRHIGEKFGIHVPFPSNATVESVTGGRLKL